MPSYVIGLDLGSSSVKAAVLKGSLRGYEIVDFLSLEPSSIGDTQELPSPAAERMDDEPDDESDDEVDEAAATHDDSDAPLLAPDPRFEAARRVMEAVGSPQATVVAAIAAERASTWLLEMPFTDKKRIAQTVGFEAENYVPWDLEDVVLDYEIVHSGSDGARLFTAMVQRERIGELLARLTSIEVAARHITVDAAELARLVPASEECEAIIDVGASRALVCVAFEGRPQFVRSLEIDHEELEDEGLDGLVARVRASLLAAEESGAPSLDAVLLTGGGSGIEGLAEALVADLGLPVEMLELPPSPVNPDVAPTPEPEHALCYALALKGFADKAHLGIDLRRDEFAWKADSRLYTRLAFAAVAAMMLLAVGLVAMHFYELNQLQRRLDDANAHLISTVQTAFPSVPATALLTPDGAIGVTQEQVYALQGRADALEGPPLTPLEAMKELSTTVPDDITVDIDEYLANNDMIRIRGQTDSFGSVDRIEAAILANPRFVGAQKSDVNKARDGKMRFVVTIPRYPEEEVGG